MLHFWLYNYHAWSHSITMWEETVTFDWKMQESTEPLPATWHISATFLVFQHFGVFAFRCFCLSVFLPAPQRLFSARFHFRRRRRRRRQRWRHRRQKWKSSTLTRIDANADVVISPAGIVRKNLFPFVYSVPKNYWAQEHCWYTAGPLLMHSWCTAVAQFVHCLFLPYHTGLAECHHW